MPEVNFYLKTAEKVSGLHLVLLQMRYQGNKFVYSCGFRVAKSEWDKKKQKLRSNSKTDKMGGYNLNERLKNLKRECEAAYYKEMAAGTPTNAKLKKHLGDYLSGDDSKSKGPSLLNLIDRFIAGEIGDEKTEGTLKTYQTAKKHLLAFEATTKNKLTFESITLDFRDAYVKYLAKDKKEGKKIVKGLSPNSIQKEIKNIRTFLNTAVERGYTKNIVHKSDKFGVKGQKTDSVYLTDKELRDLFKYDFSDNSRLERVRDLFVFQAFVGLRYSDASNIKPENIVTINGKTFIKIVPAKTKKSGRAVTIPCNDIVLKIFKKYAKNENRLPPSIEGQPFNRYIKEAAKIAGLTATGRLSSDMNSPLYKCITSHTARRSFATNCYLAGMDITMIRAVTCHETEKSFLLYIKVSSEEYGMRMSEHMEKALTKSMLKAVS